MEHLTTAQGTFTLARYPRRSKEQLRAWDAADELLLDHLAGRSTDLFPAGDPGGAPDPGGTTVVVNDSWGALAVALARVPRTGRLVSYGDSYTAHLALATNLAANEVAADAVTVVGGLDPLPERIDTLVLKLPRANELLSHQLRRLASRLHPGTTVVAAAMTKHVHRSTLDAFASWIGPATTSLARKKARLIVVRPDSSAQPSTPVEPTTFTLEPMGLQISGFPGVFAADRPDSGTSLLLDHLPGTSGPVHIVDLGCGTGIVGLVALHDNPDARVSFIDDSYLAVESARRTVRTNLGPAADADFIVGCALDDLRDHAPLEPGSVDLVLNNPPFHLNHALSDATAWQMFTGSRRVLRPGGELWVVGNRHLGYHAKLKRIFGNCEVVAATPRFVVLRAERR